MENHGWMMMFSLDYKPGDPAVKMCKGEDQEPVKTKTVTIRG